MCYRAQKKSASRKSSISSNSVHEEQPIIGFSIPSRREDHTQSIMEMSKEQIILEQELEESMNHEDALLTVVQNMSSLS